MFGVSREAVRKFLKKLGIERREASESITKHILDHDFFSRINSDVKAYWLGVLLARGAIYNTPKHGRMVMCPVPLHMRDLLLRFAEATGSSRALYKFKNRDRVSMIVNSASWIGDLKTLGWYEYHGGNREFLLDKIDSKLHKFIEAGITAASE